MGENGLSPPRARFAAILAGILFALVNMVSPDSLSQTESNTFIMPLKPPDPLAIRVGLLEDYEKLTFSFSGQYCIESLAGDPVRSAAPSAVKWRARVEQSTPAQFLFSVLANSFSKQADALVLAEQFESDGTHAVVRQIGGPIEVEGRVVGDNTLYRVQVGNFRAEADAVKFAETLYDDYAPRIVREVLRAAQGTIELFDAELIESFTVKNGLRLVPASDDAAVTVYGVRTGSGFHYEPVEDRTYGGILEIYFDHTGQLAAVNEIPIDTYLKGVVPSEMPAGFPAQALCAQAIIARSVVLSEKGIKHLNDRYDICAHVHCQVYSGLTQEDRRTNAAVEATRGQVLVNGERLVMAHYSAVCGGHTEDAEATWATGGNGALRGHPCSCNPDANLPDLTTETGVRQWVNSTPDVCCNLAGLDLPVSADYSRRHFRWEISYSRTELEEIIREKTGVDVGTLYDILPVKRGVSGRLIEIEILGSRRNLRVQRELRIRRGLHKSALPSSCFVVDVVSDADGMPMEIVFTGAGYGHGVGLCQCGAARQAAEERACEDILRFYFPETKVVKLY
ncbi:MAG: SpoIID/LytB domain-containing protein [bacterium]|nr:SpoIID/LytB domain-containing protein [bacterium]